MKTWLKITPTRDTAQDSKHTISRRSPVKPRATSSLHTPETAQGSCDDSFPDSVSYSTRKIEIVWDDVVQNKDDLRKMQQQQQIKNPKQQHPHQPNESSSVFGWMYNFMFTQCIGAGIGGSDMLCSPTSVNRTSNTNSSNTRNYYPQQRPYQSTKSKALGRVKTDSSENLGIIAPPEILRQPTNPFIPNNTATNTNITLEQHGNNLLAASDSRWGAYSLTSASF